MYQRIILATATPDGEPGPLPALIDGLDQCDLDDLSFLPAEHGFSGIGYWPVIADDPPFDPATQALDEPVSYTVDAIGKRVLVARTVRALTAAELEPLRLAAAMGRPPVLAAAVMNMVVEAGDVASTSGTFNVSGVLALGTGTFLVMFCEAMAADGYAVLMQGDVAALKPVEKAADYFIIEIRDGAGDLADPSLVCIQVFV